MKKHKILTQTILYVTLCIFCALYLSFFDFGTNEDSWKNHMDTNYEVITSVDENGNNINIAKISTPEQLAGVMYSSNSIQAESINAINLTANLDMQGKTWDSIVLNNDFDGKGYTIKNLTISSSTYQSLGFTSEIGSNRTLKNVVFENLNVTDSYSKDVNNAHAGGVAGVNRGTIDNVVVLSGTITTTNLDYIADIGGLVGYNYGVIKNCTNYASVSRGVHTGGIVGMAYSGQITNCKNHGTISAGRGYYLRTGGIAGERTTTSITFCLNYGTISNNNTDINSLLVSNDSIGGIIGYDSYSGTLSENANYGNIESTTNTAESCVGGIVGYKASGRIENCYSMDCSITAVSTLEALIEIGSDSSLFDRVSKNSYFKNFYNGLKIGYSSKWRDGIYEWRHEYQLQQFILDYTLIAYNAYAGGIVGKINNSGTVANSYTANSTISGGYKYERISGTTDIGDVKQRNEWIVGWDVKSTEHLMIDTISGKCQNYCGSIIGNFADATETNTYKYNTNLEYIDSYRNLTTGTELTMTKIQNANPGVSSEVTESIYVVGDDSYVDYSYGTKRATYLYSDISQNDLTTLTIRMTNGEICLDWYTYSNGTRSIATFSLYTYDLGEGKNPTTTSTSYYNKTSSLSKPVRDLYLGNRMIEASSAFAVDNEGKINNGYPYLNGMYY